MANTQYPKQISKVDKIKHLEEEYKDNKTKIEDLQMRNDSIAYEIQQLKSKGNLVFTVYTA